MMENGKENCFWADLELCSEINEEGATPARWRKGQLLKSESRLPNKSKGERAKAWKITKMATVLERTTLIGTPLQIYSQNAIEELRIQNLRNSSNLYHSSMSTQPLSKGGLKVS
jgi:hypothetical protein